MNNDYSEIRTYSLSNDHGQTWKLLSLCKECKQTFEPPTRRIDKGQSGAGRCEWCGIKNSLYRPN